MQLSLDVPHKVAIVTAKYMIMRFSEKQSKLMEVATDVALAACLRMTSSPDSFTARPPVMPSWPTIEVHKTDFGSE